MDPQNLATASLYINNLLAARGLLKNGKSIPFADPESEDGGVQGTMGRIINIVHDLILRKDVGLSTNSAADKKRDAEHCESLGLAIRNLRAADTKHCATIERLEQRNADLDRQLSIARGQERAFAVTLKTAENSARSFRDEAVRLKSTLQQVRTQCTNDVRKRDLQIQKLKAQITGQQRGARPPQHTTTISIVPPVIPSTTFARDESPGDDPGYSLRQETNDFLTALCQQMSDENDNLVGLIRSTLITLRTLQGIAVEDAEENISQFPAASAPQTSYEFLAMDLDDVLDHLRGLLTNPSFVPIEEVRSRDEEIARLKEGWLKIEAKWKDAIDLMESWRKRVAKGGSSVKLEELRLGVGLADSTPQLPEPEALADEEFNSASEEDVEPEHDLDEPLGIGLAPDGNVLSEINHNVKGVSIPVNFGDESDSDPKPTKQDAKPVVSRIPRHKPAVEASPKAIKRKLDDVSAEAEAARRRVKSKTTAKPQTKKGSRRRSTLSPQELQSLMSGRIPAK